MSIFIKKIYLVCCLLSISIVLSAQTALQKLIEKKVPSATVKKLKAKDHFKESYEIMIKQPLDHKNPAAGYFEQRVFLHHADRKRPMLMVTEGYGAGSSTYELATAMNSNQLTVEYRYYGKSKPINHDWKYLKNDHAMDDLHRLRKLFGKIYKKKWVATGISKGGTTTLTYKYRYPKDVKASVAYVAPLALAQEDKRLDEHILSVGSEACRNKLDAFQKEALKRRENLVQMVEDWAVKEKKAFEFMGYGRTFEYAVLEYTFSFWQWGADCSTVPALDASDKEYFEHLNKVVGFDFYSDATCDYFRPSYYQFVTELGYYGFIKDHVSDLLVDAKEPTNLFFAPQNTDLSFTQYCKPVIDWLNVNGDKIIYIYGAIDTWTAAGYHPSKTVDALRLDLKDGPHTTRIASFSKEDQDKVYAKMNKWLKMKLKPLY